jgi:hypothetical protein
MNVVNFYIELGYTISKQKVAMAEMMYVIQEHKRLVHEHKPISPDKRKLYERAKKILPRFEGEFIGLSAAYSGLMKCLHPDDLEHITAMLLTNEIKPIENEATGTNTIIESNDTASDPVTV